MENSTPMLRQYLEIKKLYPGTLLFFRLGDFYELFNEDAIVGSRELEIVLTARQKDSKNPIPMCGVPYHAASNYISRLIKKGYRVAICEQTETPSKGTKLVKREVVKVITPGTAVDPRLVDSKDSVFLASLSGAGETFGAAFLDISTGNFSATQIGGPTAWDKILETVESVAPKEILFPLSMQRMVESAYGTAKNAALPTMAATNAALPTMAATNGDVSSRPAPFSFTLTPREDHAFDTANCHAVLTRQLKTKDLTGYGLAAKTEAIRAAGACLQYAQETQRAAAEHISEIEYFESTDFMILDSITLKNLEITESTGDDNRKRTLLGVIDETITGMGGRLLKSWLLRPSIKRSEIQTRLSAVTELTDAILRNKVRFLLKEVSDLERLVGRLNLGNASARDLIALERSLSQAPKINETLADAQSLLIQVLSENIFELPEVRSLIQSAILDDPSLNITDGGTIRSGFNSELDELREISRNAKQVIASFEEQEKHRTGIQNLKVRFNNVFGYYIEISKGNVARAPADYERRQTLTNAERFTTPQLKEWEQKVLGAEEKIIELEIAIFDDVRNRVRAETQPLQSTARALATLDALASFAETAAKRNFVCPMLHDGDDIEIKNGRHPIVEAFINESFIPNDIYLNNSTDRLMMITGANMGGKSTILRQVALIQILAQIGSFVPATQARLPILDRIWTRVGASDDLASGRSTFMVEMTETATILHNATPRSLVLLDEIGRGTSTFDGLSIAWAVAEYLHDSPEHSAKTMFATHYHELTELAENLPGAKNYRIAVSEEGGEVVFLHKLEKGKSSKSYGIAVAGLAGLPPRVIHRAKEVLSKLESHELAVFADASPTGIAHAAGKKLASQLSLFAIANERAIDELRSLDVEKLSAEETREILRNVKGKIV